MFRHGPMMPRPRSAVESRRHRDGASAADRRGETRDDTCAGPDGARRPRHDGGGPVEQLSKEAGLSPEDVTQLERGGEEGIASARLRTTLEGAGIAFLDADGVRYDPRLGMARTVPLEEMNSYNDE